jgi:hypothetical protein
LAVTSNIVSQAAYTVCLESVNQLDKHVKRNGNMMQYEQKHTQELQDIAFLHRKCAELSKMDKEKKRFHLTQELNILSKIEGTKDTKYIVDAWREVADLSETHIEKIYSLVQACEMDTYGPYDDYWLKKICTGVGFFLLVCICFM